MRRGSQIPLPTLFELVSYGELEKNVGERGVAVDHTTFVLGHSNAPALEKHSAWYRSRLSFAGRRDLCASHLSLEVPLPRDRLALALRRSMR
jgi:hypothetical protein